MAPAKILQVHCSGTPREIGIQHGLAAFAQLQRGLKFYREYFKEKSNLDWPEAVAAAEKFLPILEADWPEFLEEMKGIADGASSKIDVSFSDILAMNCRSEISMGLMNDGCTSLSATSSSTTLLAQNWDWDERQQDSLVAITISAPGKPTISQVTEAGILGKIGFNSAGLGVCLNAIRCKGVDFTRLPLHLANRSILNSTSKSAAIAKLEKVGVASAGHILVADVHSATGLEWSHVDLEKLEAEEKSAPTVTVAHTNHFLLKHADGIKEAVFLGDSRERIVRIQQLIGEAKSKKEVFGTDVIEAMLDDEMGFPAAINRAAGGGSTSATLFSIVMDLAARTASVRVGRPTEGGERLLLKV